MRQTLPGYWMNETGGVLKPAMEAYLNGEELSLTQWGAIREYLRQWMAGDWKGREIASLRADIHYINGRREMDRWLARAELQGIDPL